MRLGYGIMLSIVLAAALPSCQRQSEGEPIMLKVRFFDYIKAGLRTWSVDEAGNQIEKMRDLVHMKVVSAGEYQNRVYMIGLLEKPIRTQFQSENRDFDIVIGKNALDVVDRTADVNTIFSRSISFR